MKEYQDYLNNPEVTFNPKYTLVENYNRFLKQVSNSFELHKAVISKHKVLKGHLLVQLDTSGDELKFDIFLYDNYDLTYGDYDYAEYGAGKEVEETVLEFFKENYPCTYELLK